MDSGWIGVLILVAVVAYIVTKRVKKGGSGGVITRPGNNTETNDIK